MSESGPVVVFERRGLAAVIVMNRPAKRNALSVQLLDGILEGLTATEQDKSLRAVVLTGAPPVFCSGMDLDQISADPGGAAAVAGKLLYVLRRLYEHPLPTIAAVNGSAVAGGAGLMTACDLAVVSRGSFLGYPEVRRGLVAAMVMSFLIRQVGDRAARALMLTGELIDADEAVRIGLATLAVPPENLVSQVDAIVAALAEGGPDAIKATKKLFGDLGRGTLSEDLTMTNERYLQSGLSDEALEGLAAFRGKRKPKWAPK